MFVNQIYYQFHNNITKRKNDSSYNTEATFIWNGHRTPSKDDHKRRSMTSYAKKKYHFCQKEMITQLPILVPNIWPLPKHLPRIMTCPEHIQKLSVVNQPGIILNLHDSRAETCHHQSSFAQKTLQCLVLPNVKMQTTKLIKKTKQAQACQHAR
jgi:hypothetical protein